MKVTVLGAGSWGTTVASLLLVGAPTGYFRDTPQNARPHLAPWIPVISLSKGSSATPHLRMTGIGRAGPPGPARGHPPRSL